MENNEYAKAENEGMFFVFFNLTTCINSREKLEM